MSRLRNLLLSTLVLAATPANAASHAFVTGKFLDATTDERLNEGTSFRRAMFTVQVGDIIYTLKGGRVSARAKDITHGLIVGDPVQVSVEGEHMYLLTPNGKDMKTDIMKRARPQVP